MQQCSICYELIKQKPKLQNMVDINSLDQGNTLSSGPVVQDEKIYTP